MSEGLNAPKSILKKRMPKENEDEEGESVIKNMIIEISQKKELNSDKHIAINPQKSSQIRNKSTVPTNTSRSDYNSSYTSHKITQKNNNLELSEVKKSKKKDEVSKKPIEIVIKQNNVTKNVSQTRDNLRLSPQGYRLNILSSSKNNRNELKNNRNEPKKQDILNGEINDSARKSKETYFNPNGSQKRVPNTPKASNYVSIPVMNKTTVNSGYGGQKNQSRLVTSKVKDEDVIWEKKGNTLIVNNHPLLEDNNLNQPKNKKNQQKWRKTRRGKRGDSKD